MATRVASAHALPVTVAINNNIASSLYTCHLLQAQLGMKQ